MRIVVWNAHMAFARKQSALMELKPDLAVIPECESQVRTPPGCWAWVGLHRHKGLGIVSYGDYKLSLDEDYDDDPKLRWAAPIAVSGRHKFFLLAIWAQPPYREPVHRALERYRKQLTTGPAVVAGDFNQNPILDGPGRRTHSLSRNVKLMKELGMVSAYHNHFAVDHGREQVSTHYWRYKTQTESIFHIDYCFVPNSWLKRVSSVEIGEAPVWIESRLSDHVPLVVDIRME